MDRLKGWESRLGAVTSYAALISPPTLFLSASCMIKQIAYYNIYIYDRAGEGADATNTTTISKRLETEKAGREVSSIEDSFWCFLQLRNKTGNCERKIRNKLSHWSHNNMIFFLYYYYFYLIFTLRQKQAFISYNLKIILQL